MSAYFGKQGLFWRIFIDDGRLISKRRFLSSWRAWRYLDAHTDKYGIPVKKNKRKEKK